MMPDCKVLIHPFQTDQGTSQRQRLPEDLLSGQAKIDGRSLADLLIFFVKLSRHVNYYDDNLQVSDWQPFFQKSLPFTLAAMVTYDHSETEKKLNSFKKKFEKQPAAAGLQLLLSYTYNNILKRIDNWQRLVSGAGIPLDTTMEKLIKDKLSGPVKEFIRYANTGTKWYCTRKFSFRFLMENKVWMLMDKHLVDYDEDFISSGTTKRKRLIVLYKKVSQLVQSFLDVIRLFSASAEMSMEQSLLPLKEEFQERHAPHLAIIFAFIKLYQQLQDDLNIHTRKHLDFFYKEVLKLKPAEAVPDKVHMVFEIQRQLDQYLLKKGLLLKDGKDNKKTEIYFSTDDEIVVNKTQVADQRTLFLYNQVVKRQRGINCDELAVVEGVYMAPDATKANGIDKEFKDGIPSRATLGSKWSKFIDPENKFTYPYPNARLGFILASPVLLLNEGTRTITITLECELDKDYCKSISPQTEIQNPCCDEPAPASGTPDVSNIGLPNSLESDDLFAAIKGLLNKTFYYVNCELIALAVKKGISKELQEKLNQLLVVKHIKKPKLKTDIADLNLCFCPWEEKLYEITLPAQKDVQHPKGFENIFTKEEREVLKDFFEPRKALNILFSGEKEWITPKPDELQPNEFLNISMNGLVGNYFTLTIISKLTPEQAGVTFYNAESLKEDFNTTFPLVKIELDDKIKLQVPLSNCAGSNSTCCEKQPEGITREVSLYHFFRNVQLQPSTQIDVKVCGVKNLIVQNDENIEDVNSPIRAFGSRPKVGASFYIGSQEIFSKNWQDIYINAEWKDRPVNFEKQYEQYAYTGFTFEDGSPGILESSFKIRASVLDNTNWRQNGIRRLFKPRVGPPAELPVASPPWPVPPAQPEVPSPFCGVIPLSYNQDVYDYNRSAFSQLNNYTRRDDLLNPLTPLNIASQYGFLRLTLEGVGFQHDNYGFVLARQMMALADLVSPTVIGPVIEKAKEIQKLIIAIIARITSIDQQIVGSGKAQANLIDLSTQVTNLQTKLGLIITALGLAAAAGSIGAALPHIGAASGIAQSLINNEVFTINTLQSSLSTEITEIFNLLHDNVVGPINVTTANLDSPRIGLIRLSNELKTRIDFIVTNLVVDPNLKIGLPNDPYTPTLKSLSVDYFAIAKSDDIDLIHLYPYKNTYKPESLPQQPMLFPTFCDEGNFYIGLKDLVPGSNVNILFQLAEATADSESVREEVAWYYLENNTWKLLRTGFEVLDDDTNGLTSSGIIRFLLPANMTNENSILPKGLHWIKATIPQKSKSVSEIYGIHTQAIKATFTNDNLNDKLRLSLPLAANSVAKLKEADSSLKKITQPYDSFGGREPGEEKHFYIRTSELLRHKNRAIQKFDYERLTLEAFPQIYKVKCINHSYALDANKYFNDFPIAPGYVLIAVIPDLTKMKAAKSFEPKAPVSLLEDIAETLKKITSPFVRLWIKNPRYEKVNFCLRVKLLPGKDEVYYKEKLRQDVREFLAPWAIGEFSKLTFGQPINRSDIIRFLESRDYMDYIVDMRMIHADEGADIKSTIGEVPEIVPITPRSILIAGSIDVCIDSKDCESWCMCKDAEGKKSKPCCDHEKIPIMQYCTDQPGL